jgi:hypothetical protein
VAPFLFDRAVQDTGRGPRHRAERITVEIDDAFRNHETIAEAAQRIGRIARDRPRVTSWTGGIVKPKRDDISKHKNRLSAIGADAGVFYLAQPA